MRRSSRVQRRLQRLHAELQHRALNFDPHERPGAGWHIDDYRQPLPAERPGPPVPGGSWEAARDLVRDYQFADPSIIRSAYRSPGLVAGDDMLLEGRFYGLRFYLGVRVGGVVDETVIENGRRARVWGWNYRTLEGHLERGQMDQSVRKWLDTGQVEFHLHAFSQPADIQNPVIRVGFALFGRATQRRFQRHACRRMEFLTKLALADQERTPSERRA